MEKGLKVKGAQILKFRIFGRYTIYIFHLILMHFFELIVTRTSVSIPAYFIC